MTRNEESLGSGSLGGVPGTSSNLPTNAQGHHAERNPDSQTQSSKSGERHLWREQAGPSHHPAGARQIKRIAAALLVDDAVQVVQQNNNQRLAARRKRTADEMKQDRGAGGSGAWASMPSVATCWRWKISRSRTSNRTRPRLRLCWKRRSATCSQWTWLLRYLALACLFGSVYLAACCAR